MFNRYWGKGTAVGLTLGVCLTVLFFVWVSYLSSEVVCAQASQCSNSATSQSEEKQENTNLPNWWSLAQRLVSSEDTLAQWIMALLSFAAVVVSAAAVIYVKKSLDATHLALGQAKDANSIAREIGQAQTRAYADASKAHFFWGGKGRGSPRVELWIRAFGNTPAKWHQVRMHHFVIPYGEGTLDIPWRDLSDAHLVGKWSVLVAGDERKITLHLRSHRESIAKCLTRISEAPTHEFYVFGDITYCTFFDEIFTTQFCFARVAMPDYEASKTEHIAQVGMVNYTRSHEKPIHLVRPACDLEAYKKLDA